MKKGNKRAMALTLTFVLMLASMIGCSNSKTESSKNANSTSSTALAKTDVTYPLKSTEKLKFGMVIKKEWSDRFKSFADLPLGKALQEQTGVNLEMVHVENNSAMNLLFASGDLPDIVLFNFQSNYTGGEMKAIEDGIVYPMNSKFLEQNAPDYWKVLNSNKDYLKGSTTPTKDVYGFTFILGDDRCKTGYGLTVRDDWCKELGIESPDTPDDFRNMLIAFRDKKNAPSPFSVTSDEMFKMLDQGVLTSAFNLVTTDIYQKDKKVQIGYAQKEYKDVLTYLNKLYKEKLLDPNFSTLDSATVTANILSGKSGASAGALGGGIGTWLQTNKNVKNFSLGGIHNLVKNKGDKALYGQYNTDVVGGTAVITTSCKNKDLAAQFLNYGYTDKGHMLYVFGIEGQSYNMVNNYPTFSDYIMKNPNGLTVKKAMAEYTLSYDNGPFVQDIRNKEQTANLPQQLAAWKIWDDNDAKLYKIPRITINKNDLSEYSSKMSDIKTYVNEMTIKFIRGTEPLENYDKYLANLNTMGVERLREIVQASLDEYYSR